MSRQFRPLLPHETLLLECATPLSDERTRRAVAAVVSTPHLDWPAAARLALRHGVAQCVAHHLRSVNGATPVPETVTACFERMYRANDDRNRVFFRECGALLRAFAAAGIPCLVLKGVALSLTVYPEPALRNFADIDLLVAPQHYAAAGEVAEACGFIYAFPEKDPYCVHQPYAISCPEDILTETIPLEYEQEIPHAVVVANRHRILVEIHRGLFRDANGLAREADTAMLWESARTAALPDGTPFTYPSVEVMLFHLAAHAADHNFGRLMFFMDIAATIRHCDGEIDWDRIVKLSNDQRVDRHVYRSLELAQRAFGAAVPQAALEQLAPVLGHGAAHDTLTLSDVLVAPLQDRRAGFIRRLLLYGDWRQSCRSLLSTIAPPPLMMRRIYGVQHPLQIAALYLVRPLLLLIHLARHLLARRRNDGTAHKSNARADRQER